MRSKRALASLAVLALGLGFVGADAAVADPKPAAAPAPPLDPTPTTSSEIPNLGLVKNQIKFYCGDPTSTGVASPTSPYAREVRRDETRLRTWLANHKQGPKKPALVLDDIFAELDGDRQRRLAARLVGDEMRQCFVSAPRLDELPSALTLPRWDVDAGRVGTGDRVAA